MLRVLALSQKTTSLLLPRTFSRCVSRAAQDVIRLEPVPPSRFEETITLATPYFLGEEGLSRCFLPCTTGARERAFRATAKRSLDSGLGILALDPGGNIVGAHFACPQHRDEVIGVDIDTLGEEIEDPQEKHILRFFTLIHQRMDIFSVLGTSEIADFTLMFVEKPYRGQGLATRLVIASLEQAAHRGFRAVKGDSTSLAANIATQRAMTVIHSVPFKEYTSNGDTIFANAIPPDDVIHVSACRLQNGEPYIVPLTEFEVKQARENYLTSLKNA